jgi:hypothetical protein
LPQPSQPTTTTTTPVLVSPCDASQFLVQLDTDKVGYPSGGTVLITLSVTNTGQPCSGFEGSGPCFDAAKVSNASGQIVWVSNLGPYACPALMVRSVPSGWTDSDQLSWAQDECPSLGSGCTHARVALGRYSIVGYWYPSGFNAPSRSQPVTITIT